MHQKTDPKASTQQLEAGAESRLTKGTLYELTCVSYLVGAESSRIDGRIGARVVRREGKDGGGNLDLR